MKRFLVLMTVVLLVVGSLAGCAPKEEPEPGAGTATDQTGESAGEPIEFVVSTWGFNEDILKKNVFEPFEAANNVKIIVEVGNNSDRLNKLRTMKNSKVDVIFLAEAFAMEGISEGLFEPIDANNIPNLKNIYEFARNPHGEYGPAYTVGRTGIVYDSAMVEEEVKSWSDLWRTEFASNMSVPEITTTAGPAIMILAAEQAGADVFEDPDAAFAKIAELKPNLVKTFSRSSELVNMFNQGEVIIGVTQDFGFGSIKEAIPTAVWVDPVEGAFANLNTINIVKGSENKEIAEKFIDWYLSDEVQLANALDRVDSPVNVNVELTAEQADGLTYGDEVISNLRLIDWAKVNEVKGEWIDRWNREVSN